MTKTNDLLPITYHVSPSRNYRRKVRERWPLDDWRRRTGGRGEADAVVPVSVEADLRRSKEVVSRARDEQNARRRHGQLIDREPVRSGIRLVGAGPFRGDDHVEAHAGAFRRDSAQALGAIGDDPELVASRDLPVPLAFRARAADGPIPLPASPRTSGPTRRIEPPPPPRFRRPGTRRNRR